MVENTTMTTTTVMATHMVTTTDTLTVMITKKLTTQNSKNH